jgi:hypothetical protein
MVVGGKTEEQSKMTTIPVIFFGDGVSVFLNKGYERRDGDFNAGEIST